MQSFFRGIRRPSTESKNRLLTENTDQAPIQLESVQPISSNSRSITTDSPTKSSRFFNGWRVGAGFFALGAFISLVFNVVFAVWTSKQSDGAITALVTTDCDTVSSYNTLIHAGVNAMSTLLLSGSNYCMQCLSAPTRNELQRAHFKGIWLDIGVPSIRNLRNVTIYRAILWGLLVLSSVPLHLMYNSAFFMSLSANEYMVYIVSEDFWNSTDAVPTVKLLGTWSDPLPSNATNYLEEIRDSIQKNQTSSDSSHEGIWYEALDNHDCIREYATDFLTGRRTIVITSNITGDSPFAIGYEYNARIMVDAGSYHPYQWICDLDAPEEDPECYQLIREKKIKAQNWTPTGYPARYCYSERIAPNCSLYASKPIFYAISACNLVKVLIMAFIAIGLRENPLITLGDAVESFLNYPDSTTENMCLLSKRAVTKDRIWPVPKSSPPLVCLVAREERHRWSDSVSTRRWISGILIIAMPFLAVVVLFGLGIKYMKYRSTVPPFSTGFGKINGAALISGESWAPAKLHNHSQQILLAAVISNIPQIIFSFMSFTINGILTSICLAQEWKHFGDQHQGKALRVSSPQGQQRSTYFLQLPYRLSVPFTVISGVLHWILSQSIFLAVVAAYNPWGILDTPVYIVTCGYSPLAMLLVIAVGILMCGSMITFRFLKFRTVMPLVGSCSAAISAACHDLSGDGNASLQPVQWGAIPNRGEADIGHCCFTSGVVERPVAGRLYAGK